MQSVNPLVSILMGSPNDLEKMQEASRMLKEFSVAHEIRISSAHRNPAFTVNYVKTAETRGVRVFICGAGMAAHLAGVVAAHTSLPVIGVPLSSPGLQGQDSLYSTVQMPPGIPVATVAIGGAKNAAILATQILSLESPSLKKQLTLFKEKLAEDNQKKNELL